MKPRALLYAVFIALVLRGLTGLWEPAASAVHPFLIIAVLSAISGRRPRTLGAALLGGAIEDAWVGRWYGEYSFIHLVVAYPTSLIANLVDLMQPVPAALAFATATAADWGLQVVLAMVFDQPVGALPGAGAWAVAIVANTVLGLIGRRLLLRFGGFEE